LLTKPTETNAPTPDVLNALGKPFDFAQGRPGALLLRGTEAISRKVSTIEEEGGANAGVWPSKG
jgi:hypothetical protein